MKLVTLIVVFSMLIFFSPNTIFAIDLNTPIETKPTIRSEIKRGYQSIFTFCHSAMYLEELKICVDKVKEENLRQDKETESFLLGFYFGAWHDTVVSMFTLRLLEKPLKEANLKEPDYAFGEIWGIFYFMDFRKIQKQFGIDDLTLCDITGARSEDVIPEIRKWEQKMPK